MRYFEQALQLLVQGEFVCPHRYRDCFEALDTEEGRREATRWVEIIGYRLCQFEDGGAFFMAYDELNSETRGKLREEMANLRDRLQPAVRYLETLRQAHAGAATLQPGDEVSQSAVVEAVRTNTVLARRLEEMTEVRGARTDEKSVDKIERILRLLRDAGYLHLGNPDLMVYTVTGKITYLYQLLAFMAEHVPFMKEQDVQDALDEGQQLSLRDGSQAGGEAA
jgi:hypothetical protein